MGISINFFSIIVKYMLTKKGKDILIQKFSW